MTNILSLLVLSVVLSAAAEPQRATKASDVRNRDIFVSVVDGSGNVVRGLTAKDFTVREDGVSREVIRAEPATGPLEVILVVDDSQAATNAIPYLRDGLNKFIDRMAGKAQIGLVTIGERPTVVTERTNDVAALKKGVTRIFQRTGAGAYLLQGLRDVSKGLRLRETQRPVIVAVTMEGVEFSNDQGEAVVKDILASGAALHVLAVGRPAEPVTDELRQRNIALADGTEQSGGRREQLLTEMSIPPVLEKLADELLNQYVVTYGRPEMLIPPERVQVGVTRQGLTARARTRLPSK